MITMKDHAAQGASKGANAAIIAAAAVALLLLLPLSLLLLPLPLLMHGAAAGPASADAGSAADADRPASADVGTVAEEPASADVGDAAEPASAVGAGADGQAGVSAMEGYVSRYNPMHMDSATAWAIVESGGGAVVLDVRSADAYAERHVSGAANVQFEEIEAYAAANIPDKSTTIICYCYCGDMGGPALSACELLMELGYINTYYTEPGDEWQYEGTEGGAKEGDAMKETLGHRVVTGAEAKQIVDSDPTAVLLDVRSQGEYDEGHIEGSLLIPVGELRSRLSELPDKGAAIIVYCKSGGRSKTAYDELAAAGYTDLYDMQAAAKWPLPLSSG